MSQYLRPEAHFARIAKKLSVIELMNDDDGSEITFTARDISARTGEAPFLDFYSESGLERAFIAYGIHDKLHAKGLADYRLVVTRDDAFHHRLEIYFGEGGDDDHRVMDLRVHLVNGRVGSLENVPLFVIEWLSMQDPLAKFTAHRPRLPGQRHPSTGFGRATENLLLIAAQRLHRHALVHVPERFHLAELYLRGGSRFADERVAAHYESLYDATKHLNFAHRAWAVDHGFVRTQETTRSPAHSVTWQAHEMFMPLSKEVADHVEQRGFLKRWYDKATAPPLHFDREGYSESLRQDPIDGLSLDLGDQE